MNAKDGNWIEPVDADANERRRSIGSILTEQGCIDAEDVARIMALQRSEGLRFGEAALRLGLIRPPELSGAIAKQFGLHPLPAANEALGRELIVAREPFHPRAEEFRGLRTQLVIRWANTTAGQRRLAVVSPGSRDGRSYVAANLALAFSQLGERTLLIDADLRRPCLHRLFDVSDRVGLVALLSGRADLNAIVPMPEFGTLSLLPAGAPPPNPQELLSRIDLAVLLHDVQARFDIVIIDTPPARLYADAQIVAFRTGSALVVARKDRTRLDECRNVVRELGDMGTRVVGTVLNAF